MNKYIIAILDNLAFRTPLHIKVNNIDIKVTCKIDTGCMKTSIPMKKLLTGSTQSIDSEAYRLKKEALDKGVAYERSYGVSDTEDTKQKDTDLINAGRTIECTSLKFKFKADIFELSNFDLGNPLIGINFDRTGNILIGMDIMKDWDIHIGNDINTNETIFIACPYNQINDTYLKALENHFGIGTLINSALLRKNIC